MIYNRLIVAAIGFIRLEPYDGKLSRTVLRGGKDSNALLLPDYASVECYIIRNLLECLWQSVVIRKPGMELC